MQTNEDVETGEDDLLVHPCCRHCHPDAVCWDDHDQPCPRCPDETGGYR